MSTTLSIAFAIGLALTTAPPDRSLAGSAEQLTGSLRDQVMPYWYDTGIDRRYGGYVLEKGSKQLVAQTRMISGFSHAHRFGYGTAERDYLAAARQGYAFLTKHFLDTDHGGYYWLTDDAGEPVNRHKMIYGQAFVIYALVEYYRASHDGAALQMAMDQFRTLQQKAYDKEHGGWFEHFAPDWTPVMQPQPQVSVEVPGYKSANAHLHLMEAFTELYMESKEAAVRDALEESLKINREYFYPLEAAKSAFHCHPDWSRVTEKSSEGLSYGHNVEFAWLMLRAQEALGQPLAWDHFYAHLDYALQYGFDHQAGGLYNLGREDQPAHDRLKVWWSQAEMMAALTVSLQHQQREKDVEALKQLVAFLQQHMIDPQDGIWAADVSADGQTRWDAKKSHWKANYHDVRAIVIFTQALRGK